MTPASRARVSGAAWWALAAVVWTLILLLSGCSEEAVAPTAASEVVQLHRFGESAVAFSLADGTRCVALVRLSANTSSIGGIDCDWSRP